MPRSVKPLRFKVRNYKHEVRLAAKDPRTILKYGDEVWETLCREIARRGFTGLVLYAGSHPFEHFLDYKSFPSAASRPARERNAVRKALNRGLAIAHKHGLKTFIHHYITHYTRPLAKRLGIATASGRLANIDHPEIVRYQRWCYREVFRQCPDLDGLYFNFESGPNAYDLLTRTAIVEMNRMKRKPIAVFRLWSANDPEGVRSLVTAYRGRSVLAHKISDTNDGYFLPVADSRVSEWKALLPDTDFIFLVGPCHNCGTNHCGQLWGDYDFVQALLADAEAKGADGVSFHAFRELLSPQVASGGVFPEREILQGRTNILHLEAVADYFHRRRRTRSERVAVLAESAGVDAKAAGRLLDAVQASSQLVLLTYQQFFYGSSMEGYLNPGRYSHIQDPFFYYTATDVSDQASRLQWHPAPGDASWMQKRVDARVTPKGMLQHIIDYVDPTKPKARRHPKRIAEMLKANIDRSFVAGKRFTRAAGKEKGAQVMRLLKENATLGEFVRQEILAAIQLYGVYFAHGKSGVAARLRKGLEHLQAARKTLRVNAQMLASVKRALLLDRLDPQKEIALVRRALGVVEKTRFPMSPYADYLASRRAYNEIRREVRPHRRHDNKTVGYAVRQLKAAIVKADDALAGLTEPKFRALAGNVRDWKAFLDLELARTRPPKAACPRGRSEEVHLLQWDHCFREGEHYAEDFLAFFRKTSYQPTPAPWFAVWNTGKELAVVMGERGVDVKQRKAQWRRYREEGSSSFVDRVHVDVTGQGKSCRSFIVWPEGGRVSERPIPEVKARTEFTCDKSSYEFTLWLPYSLLGRRPKAGDEWGFNITANPSIMRNHAFTWAPQYDAGAVNPILLGRIRFE